MSVEVIAIGGYEEVGEEHDCCQDWRRCYHF